MNCRRLCSLLLAISLLGIGCDQPSTADQSTDSKPPAPGTHVHADGTVHANHADEGGHSHDNPPHGGTILDWGGGKYHLELCVDKDNQQATVYVLDSNVKETLAIKTNSIELAVDDPKFQITLNAQPLDSDPEGKTSRFVAAHESFAEDKKFSGMIFGTIGETPYSGNFTQK